MPFTQKAQIIGQQADLQPQEVKEERKPLIQRVAQPVRDAFRVPTAQAQDLRVETAREPVVDIQIPDLTVQDFEDIATRRDKGFFTEIKDSSIAAYQNTIAGFHSGRALFRQITGAPEEQVTELLEKAAERREIVERHAPSIQKVEEIEGIGDALRFGMSTVIQQLPVFGQIIGGAVIGGKTGGTVGALGGPKGALAGTAGGSLIGSFTVGYALYAGDIFETTTSMGAERDAAQRAALKYGAPAAGVSMVIPGGVGAILTGALGKKAIKSRIMEGIKATAIAVPVEGIAEAIAENFVMEGELAAIPDHVITPEERRSRTLNAGVAGGIAIGAMSGVTTAFRPRQQNATDAQIEAEVDRQLDIYEDSLRYRRNPALEQDMIEKLEAKDSLTSQEQQTLEFLRERVNQPIDEKNMSTAMQDYDNISVEVFNRSDEVNSQRLQELIQKPERTYEENLEMTAITVNKPALSQQVFERMDESQIFPEITRPDVTQMRASEVARVEEATLGELPELQTAAQEATKFVSEEEFFLNMSSESRELLRNNGILSQERIKEFWRNVTERVGRTEPILDNRTEPLGEEYIYRPEDTTPPIIERARTTSEAIRMSATETRRTIAQRLRSINELIRKSSLSQKDKGKFVFSQAQLAEIKSEEVFQKKVGDIIYRIERLEAAERFRSQKKRIDKAVRSTKVKNRISKFPASMQDTAQVLFDTLKQHSRLTQDQALEQLQKNQEELDGAIPTFEQSIENSFLAIKAGLESVTEADATQLANDLESLIEEGRTLKDLETFEKWQEIQEDIELVEGALDFKDGIATFGVEREGLLERTKNRLKVIGVKVLTDWPGLMENIDWNRPLDDKVLRDRFAVTRNNVKYAELFGDYDRNVNQSVRENYSSRFNEKFSRLPKKLQDRAREFLEVNHLTGGFVSRQVITDIINEEVNLGELKNRDGITQEMKMSRGELIKRWIELQDPTLMESFIHGNRYTEEIINSIDNAMTSEDKAFANRVMEMWQELYDQVNPVYKRVYGVNLPKNPFYSPIRRKGFDVDIEKQFGEFLGEQNFRSAVTSGSFNERINSILPIENQDVFQSLDKHFGEMSYFIAWAEQVRRFHSVFNNQNVRDGIQTTFGRGAGKNVLQRIDFQIRQFANKGHRSATGIEKPLGMVRRAFIAGKIFWKPAIAVKQMVSRVNYLEVLSVSELAKGEFDYWSNLRENSKFLREESAFMRERGRFLERDVNDLLKSDEYARYTKTKSFLNLGALWVRVGDADATIYPATWAYRRKLMLEKGLNPDNKAPQDIIDAYEDFADNTQQSSNISTQSEFQQSGQLAQMFTTFRTQQHQNARKVVNAVKSVFQDGGATPQNLKRVARTIVIYHSIQNMLFQLVATGIIQLIGGEEEEFIKDMARAGILGSLNFFPLGYDLVDSIVRAAMGSQVFTQGTQTTPIDAIAQDIYRLTRTIDSTDISDIDVMRFMQDFARIGGDFGLPTEQALNLGRGAYSTTQGNFLRGSLEMAQWSQWALRPLDENERKTPDGIPILEIPTIDIPEIRIPEIQIPEIRI